MRRSPSSLPREERLRGRTGLRRVFTTAARAELKGLKILYLPNHLPERNRIALCPVRGFPTAVQRNRQRRLTREAYRLLKPRIRRGYDLAFVLYPGQYGLAERTLQMQTLLARAGLLASAGQLAPA